MQAAGVLATSKAATRGVGEARKEREMAVNSLRHYAQILGQDDEVEEALAEGEQVLGFMAAPPSPASSARAKTATHEAMRRHRGSKDFDKT
jgi:hypothetical protein